MVSKLLLGLVMFVLIGDFLSSPMDRNTIMIRDIYSEWEKKVVILSQGRKSL